MATLRAIRDYRKAYPNTSYLLQTIGMVLGINYKELLGTSKKATSEIKPEVTEQNLQAIEGIASMQIPKDTFKNYMDIIDRPVDY